MKKQIIIVGIIVILLTVGLSGCNEQSRYIKSIDSTSENDNDSDNNNGSPAPSIEYKWFPVPGGFHFGSESKKTETFNLTDNSLNGNRLKIEWETKDNSNSKYSSSFKIVLRKEGGKFVDILVMSSSSYDNGIEYFTGYIEPGLYYYDITAIGVKYIIRTFGVYGFPRIGL